MGRERVSQRAWMRWIRVSGAALVWQLMTSHSPRHSRTPPHQTYRASLTEAALDNTKEVEESRTGEIAHVLVRCALTTQHLCAQTDRCAHHQHRE